MYNEEILTLSGKASNKTDISIFFFQYAEKYIVNI